MLESYTKAKINIREYIEVIYEANTFRKENYKNEEIHLLHNRGDSSLGLLLCKLSEENRHCGVPT
jgi:hypothetical protein